LQTDNYASDIAGLRSNGARVMLEQVSNGRHVAFIEARRCPDGADREDGVIQGNGGLMRP